MTDGSNVVGVLGGTFDPVHFGHLRLGIEAMDALGLEAVRIVPARIVPAGVPSHRAKPAAPAAARLQMVRLATAAETRFSVDAAEAESPSVSYTVDTLMRLRNELGSRQGLCLLLGADAFGSLATWSRWERLFELAHIAVASRAGQSFDPDSLPPALGVEFTARYQESAACLARAPAGCVVHFAMSALDISASGIRRLLSRGASARYLLPDAVLDYIASNNLYCRESDGR
jgi:nicotinate-nucleotide adenylyltransferase